MQILHAFVEANDRAFSLRRDVRQNADFVREVISPDDVIFVFSGNDNGERWFIYTYEFAENLVVEEIGADTNGMNEEETRVARRENLYNLFIKNGVTAVFIDNSSKEIVATYGDLFDTDVSYIGKDSAAYYRVDYFDNWFSFAQLKGGFFK